MLKWTDRKVVLLRYKRDFGAEGLKHYFKIQMKRKTHHKLYFEDLLSLTF